MSKPTPSDRARLALFEIKTLHHALEFTEKALKEGALLDAKINLKNISNRAARVSESIEVE